MANRKRRHRSPYSAYAVFITLAVLAGMVFYWWGSNHPDLPPPPVIPGGSLEIHFIDVGQADCILLKEPGGKAMLIDSGNPGDWKLIKTYLDGQNIEDFETVIFTHPDADHIGTAAMVVKSYPIANLFMPDFAKNSVLFTDLLDAIEATPGLLVTRPVPGRVFPFGEAEFTILAPNDSYKSGNDNSIVIRMVFGANSFIFTGDAEKKSEKDILKFAEDNDLPLKSDFLKLSHHGSKTSTTEAFIKAVRPVYAHITSGVDNSYSHPHDEVLARLDKYGIKYTRADRDGNVIVVSDGITITIHTEKSTG